jgi:hypothetical protein
MTAPPQSDPKDMSEGLPRYETRPCPGPGPHGSQVPARIVPV